MHTCMHTHTCTRAQIHEGRWAALACIPSDFVSAVLAPKASGGRKSRKS